MTAYACEPRATLLIMGTFTKIGDAGVRTALYEAANVILTWPARGCRPQELGDEACPARRHEEGESGAGAQARRDPASDVDRWNGVRRKAERLLPRRRRRKEEKRKGFGWGEHQPSRSVRPSPGRWTRQDRKPLRGSRPRATRLAGLILILSHQVAARALAAPTTDRRANRRRKSVRG